MPDDNNPDNLLKQLFGDVIFEYTDSQAIADGILIPFVAGDRDTGHRITTNAYNTLKEYYREKRYHDYTEQQFYTFFFAELIPLIPSALGEYDRRRNPQNRLRLPRHETQRGGALVHPERSRRHNDDAA